jgi:hypothetical protein
LRGDIGADSGSLSDPEADAIFVEAAETYTDDAAIVAATRVIAIRRLLASSAKLATYRQNQSAENLSDVFKHLMELLTYWEGKRDEAIAATSGTSAARFGGMRQKPSRVKEYPAS